MKIIILSIIFTCTVICMDGQINKTGDVLEHDSISIKTYSLCSQIPSDSSTHTLISNNFNHYSNFNKTPTDIPINLNQSSSYFFYHPFNDQKTEQSLFSPFVYSVSNNFEGADIIGYKSKVIINNKILFNMSAYFSSGYFGYLVPRRVSNASLNLGIGINITNRLFLYGRGIISLNDGINPSFMPLIGASKGFGISISYKITENLFLHGGYQRNYYRGKWHNSFYILPEYVIWKKK